MVKAFTISLILLIYACSACWGQIQDSSSNGISLGILQNPGGNLNAMITYERMIANRLSFTLAAGMMPRKSGTAFPKWFTYHLSMDGRYYFNRKAAYPMSGFFAGPFVAYQESYVWYPETGKKAYRFYKAAYGISIGYQQILWKRLRLTGGLKVGRHGRETNEYWDPEGHLVYRYIWPSWWIWYPSLSIGYSF